MDNRYEDQPFPERESARDDPEAGKRAARENLTPPDDPRLADADVEHVPPLDVSEEDDEP